MSLQPFPATPDLEARCPAHPDQPSANTCGRCGRFVCAQCPRREGLCRTCERRKFIEELPPTTLLARLTQVFVGVRASPAALSMAVQLWFYALLSRGTARLEDARTHDDLLVRLDQPVRVLFLLVALSFLLWLYSTVRVAKALGRSRQHLWWSLICWFIPVVNLVAAYRTLHQLRAGLGAPRRDRLLPFFWAAALSGGLALGLQSDLFRDNPEPGHWLLLLGAAGNGLHVAGSLLLMLIVGQTQRLVDACKAEALERTDLPDVHPA
ncbi:MAG TPA: DUF4328 domain-containing protein [Myxococcus sp.]|nr:DUF4328 domain-containing protein [Myxococcus sp.]